MVMVIDYYAKKGDYKEESKNGITAYISESLGTVSEKQDKGQEYGNKKKEYRQHTQKFVIHKLIPKIL